MRKKITYLPLGIRILPRQLFATPLTRNLEVSISSSLYARSQRMGDSVEVDHATLDILRLLPVLAGSMIAQKFLSENAISLLLEDPMFAAFVIISDYEKLAERLHSHVESSPIACEILCNYVRQKFPNNRALLDNYAYGVSAEPHRMARLILSEHSDPLAQLKNVSGAVKADPFKTPSHSLFQLLYDGRLRSPDNSEALKSILENIAKCPATLYEAIRFLKEKKVSVSVWSKFVEMQTDPRWVYLFLTQSMCQLDHVQRKLETQLMSSPAWAIEYLEHQIMEVSRLDELFRICYDNIGSSGLKKPLNLWYRIQFPETRRQLKCKIS